MGNHPLSYIEEYAFASAFTRLNYNFKGKYYAEALIRATVLQFGPNNKYGNFPAASVAWVLSDEDFMVNLPAVNFEVEDFGGKNENCDSTCQGLDTTWGKHRCRSTRIAAYIQNIKLALGDFYNL